jgi:hypothetical protein
MISNAAVAADSYYPIVIHLTETGEIRVVDSPKDLPQGKPFVVLETRKRKK